MAQPVILASDAGAYALDEAKQNRVFDVLIRDLCKRLGYGEPDTLTEEQHADVDEEFREALEAWDEAEVNDIDLRPDTEFQKLLAQYVDLANGLGAYHDAGLEEVVERWYGGVTPDEDD